MCGLFGVHSHPQAADLVRLGLYALQHRGQEGAGIVGAGVKGFLQHKDFGLVEDVFSNANFASWETPVAIGHTRYSTTGASSARNVQPFAVRCRDIDWAIAHNGNLVNTRQLRRLLESEGSILQTSMDSEILLHLLIRSYKGDIEEAFKKALQPVRGAYSLIFLIDKVLVGGRDPYGIRPLSIGKISSEEGYSYILASESSAFDLVGAEFVRDVDPGEFVVITEDGQLTSFYLDKKPAAFCVFEQIYFARPDSVFKGISVAEMRKNMGKVLAQESAVENADVVMAVPDSGNFSALGFAEEAGLPFDMGIVRNHYVGRTFLDPTPGLRSSKVKIKLNPINSLLKGRKVVLVEDSIVRGNTIRNRIKDIRSSGIKEVHLRISCPPIVSPCYFGIDFPDEQELIGAQKTVEEIRDFIGVDSLAYLSLEGLKRSLEETAFDGQCFACFDKKYPIKIDEKVGKYTLERGENGFTH